MNVFLGVQDEEDRKLMSLCSFKTNDIITGEQTERPFNNDIDNNFMITHSSNNIPIYTLNKNCMSCSGQSNTIINA
jgi:hypothetical protein